MTQHGTSGRDLARLALAQYKASPAAQQQPTGRRKTVRRLRADQGSGRDPVTLAGVIGQMNTDREWGIGVQGGSVLDQWPTLCPELVGTVQPVHYDPDCGRLDLRPASDGYATQLRLLGRQLAARINDKMGTTAVRTIRVLTPGPITPPTTAAAEQYRPETARPATADVPVRTRDDAHPGYHQTLAAIDHTPPAGQKPRLQRDWGTGEYAWLREPEDCFTDAVVALEQAAEASRGNERDAVRQAALRMARAQKAGRTPVVPTAFQRTA
ncbi:DciA family protein (plasmid) [Streptomyces sp. LZ34]